MYLNTIDFSSDTRFNDIIIRESDINKLITLKTSLQFTNKVPFGIVRAISDSMSEEDDAVEYTVFSKSAAKKSISIIIEFIKNS